MGSSVCKSITCPAHYNLNELEIVITITGFISMFCCVIVILTYYLWPHLQTTTRKLLVYLSIADYTFAAMNVIGAVSYNHIVCSNPDPDTPSRDGIIQSAIGTYASSCSYFWTMFLAVYLYVLVVKNNYILAEKLLPYFHVVSWGIPLVEVSLAAWKGKLGCNGNEEVTGGWCWIMLSVNETQDWEGAVWMLFTGKLWELIAYIVIFVLYFKIKRHFKRQLGSNRPDQLLTQASYKTARYIDQKLTFVPIAFVFLRMWGMIRFILFAIKSSLIECSSPQHQTHIDYTGWLVYLQGIGDTAQGIVNFIFFCLLTNKVRRQWIDSCSCLCQPCRKPKLPIVQNCKGRWRSGRREQEEGGNFTPPLLEVVDSETCTGSGSQKSDTALDFVT